VWWYTSVIPALGSLTQEAHKFQASLLGVDNGTLSPKKREKEKEKKVRRGAGGGGLSNVYTCE
jgi:hypothetical protein